MAASADINGRLSRQPGPTGVCPGTSQRISRLPAMTALAPEPTVLSSVSGRLRAHLADWSGLGQRELEHRVRRLPGVRRAEANPLTGNVLVTYDPAVTAGATLLDRLRDLALTLAAGRPPTGATAEPATVRPEQPPPALREGAGRHRRARIAVRGLDRDPSLVRRVTQQLQRFPGVRARASPLTGRVLVEYDAHLSDLQDLLAQVSDVEMPDTFGEDRPTHPMDPAPLVQSAGRAIGVGLGLSLIAAQRFRGVRTTSATIGTLVTINGAVGLLQSFPGVRHGVRAALGRTGADVLFTVTSLVALSLSGSPLGLIVSGAEAVTLLREVTARRAAWRRYEARLAGADAAAPGDVVRLEAGDRSPRSGEVVEGTGTTVGRRGRPVALAPGATISAGSRVAGGPVVVRLDAGPAFEPEPRPAPPAPHVYGRYAASLGPASLAYAALTFALTRSTSRTFQSLLLVNARPALIGRDAANLNAAARVMRAGVVVVGTRPDRPIRLPDVLLVDGPRLLADGLELAGVLPLTDAVESAEVQSIAAVVADAAGRPWGRAFAATAPAGAAPATGGTFDGSAASAVVDGRRYTLAPLSPDASAPPPVGTVRRRGEFPLLLTRDGDGGPERLGLLMLRPRVLPGADELVEACRCHGVTLRVIRGGVAEVDEAVARRTHTTLHDSADALAAVREAQGRGLTVAVVSDSPAAAPAFAAADLAIGRSSGHNVFPARADLLAPDLSAVAAIIEAGGRRGKAVRDAVGLSVIANGFGAVWGLRGEVGVGRASLAVYAASLLALADATVRLQGGGRQGAAIASLVDPRPERWGSRDVAAALRAFATTEAGLTTAEADRRRRRVPAAATRHQLLNAVGQQLNSPIAAVLGGAAALSLFLGDPVDAALLATTLGVNLVAGAWQERQVGQAGEALARLATSTARVLRDGQATDVPSSQLVPGDVLLLAAGDRVAADARLLAAVGLEVDEASLTGESLPVRKGPDVPGDAAHRVVLEGTDVLVGTGRAVVVAVGQGTRMGATAAALDATDVEQSPLAQRLGQVLRLAVPLAIAGGGLVVATGVLRGASLVPSLALGLTTAVSVIPEGLPLLAGAGQAGVARRLAKRNALVRRLAAVEALGRVDVACTDKTGTMTEGKLALALVSDAAAGEAKLPGGLSGDLGGGSLRRVLLTAALASPHPDASDVGAHPTDLAVVRGAEAAGLSADARAARDAESPFDPARAFHAAVVGGRLCAKGSPEAIVARSALDDAGRAAALARGRDLASRGLRVLAVAEGPATGSSSAAAADPRGLALLGFVGIRDPLRPTVPAAVARCHEAGVRVVMITGDHPATARAIAADAGLLTGTPGEVVTAAELAELHNGELTRRLERVTVVARATPLDKLRIIEGLRRGGHTVAMTGDGVNDAPALRLADVGVAMGRGGTEVARQAADVVLADDDFATLVEALVEGRGFWRNMRRGIGLLLGGNVGELGLIVGASLLGAGSPLAARQILVVNLITDALPALAVVLQRPEHRHLAGLAREGTSTLDAALRTDVLRRGAAVATPALAGYLLLRGAGRPGEAGGVAFAGIVANQLAQTLEAGRTGDTLSRPVVAAVAGSAALLAGAWSLPPARRLLGLAAPTPLALVTVAAGTVATLGLGRALAWSATAVAASPDPTKELPALPLPALLPA